MKKHCFEVQVKTDLHPDNKWITWEANLDTVGDGKLSYDEAKRYYGTHLIKSRMIKVSFEQVTI